MSDNPYAPPEAPLPDAPPAPRPSAAWHVVVLAGFAVYCILLERWGGVPILQKLVATGMLSSATMSCFLAGSGALLFGVGRQMYSHQLGKNAFITAAVIFALGLASIGWRGGWGDPLVQVFAIGIITAAFGAWVAHRTGLALESDGPPSFE